MEVVAGSNPAGGFLDAAMAERLGNRLPPCPRGFDSHWPLCPCCAMDARRKNGADTVKGMTPPATSREGVGKPQRLRMHRMAARTAVAREARFLR